MDSEAAKIKREAAKKRHAEGRGKPKPPHSAWLKHVIAVKSAHPGMKLIDAMKLAKESYKKAA